MRATVCDQALIAYIGKSPDGSVLYIEEVRTGRKTLSAASMRKYPATMNAERHARCNGLATTKSNSSGPITVAAAAA